MTRAAGTLVAGAGAVRPSVVDPYRVKIEELVDRSRGKIRADVVHDKLVAMGYLGAERTTRRAVAQAKTAWAAGRRRVFRPWVPEPGMWAQYDFGQGPMVGGTATVLFCLWLAWSRFRVVLPLLDKAGPTVFAAVDVALRRAGGVPTYLLTDNEKTVTVEHVAGVPVRNPAAAEAVTLAGLHGQEAADRALGAAATAGRFADGDLAAILAHQAAASPAGTSRAGEGHTLAQGTQGWTALGAGTSSGQESR